MGGGLIQLVAYGAQDLYLTGNPQITFFKVVYRRHTNFSIEAIEQIWDGLSTKPGKCVSTISRNGDLINRMYLEIDGTVHDGESNPTANSINSVELEIGGQSIVTHSGLWMEVWSELTEKNPSGLSSYFDSKYNGTLYQNISGMGGFRNGFQQSSYQHKFFVPLQFWFCRNVGLSLPLIALQYHEVKVILDHRFGSNDNELPFKTVDNNTLWCDFIYLDTDERRRYAEVSHEYLIEQIQEQELKANKAGSTATSYLKFNHPIKELIWVNDKNWKDKHSLPVGTRGFLQRLANLEGNNTEELEYYLRLNGHDRFDKRDIRYFTRTQIWEHHTGPGGLAPGVNDQPNLGSLNDSIGVYSFSLNPEDHQPSGTCNFSRLDEIEFIVEGTVDSSGSRIFGVNYNILRIMSGMGGLAYAN